MKTITSLMILLSLTSVTSTASMACGGSTEEDETTTGEAALTAEARARCETAARQHASQFLLRGRQEREYQQRFTECARAADGETFADTSELPLVRRRTRIASDVAARHLARLPDSVKRSARCISVMSKDTIGWGLSGGGIGAGLVSCITADGSWSSPSYLSLISVDIGPSIGFLDEDTTFIFTETTKAQAFRNDFDFNAGVYATAGNASVELSADTDGCIVVDLVQRRERNCTLAISDRVGLAAGARVQAVAVRHMQGIFGGARIGRNAKVYGSGITVDRILTTPGAEIGSDVIQPWLDTLTTGTRAAR